jgi:hypothetical protein
MPSKPYYKYKTAMGLELAIYDEQEKFIKKHYGSQAARNANYGWSVCGHANGVSVATKVYLRSGHMIVQTASDTNMSRSSFKHYTEAY